MAAMKQEKAVVLGGVCVDVLVSGVDIPQAFRKETTPAGSIAFAVGGDAINEASTIAKCGHPVRLACGVGTDFAGKLVLEQARALGIDDSSIHIAEGKATSLNCVVVNLDGERRFLAPPFAESLYFDFSISMLEGAKVLSLASLFTPPLTAPERLLPVVRAAKAMGCTVCADMNINPAMSLADYRDVLPYIDYLFPNAEESLYYTGKADVTAAAEVFRSFGVRTVLAKAGKDGAYLCGADGVTLVPSCKTRCVDTTGAGDNFAAGFISGLLDGLDDLACARRAAAAAAISVAHVGAGTGIRSKEQVLAVARTGIVPEN